MISMNEQEAVGKVIADIQAATAGRDVEILVVDSSKDRTPEIAAAAGARVVRQFPPQGYGLAAFGDGVPDVSPGLGPVHGCCRSCGWVALARL